MIKVVFSEQDWELDLEGLDDDELDDVSVNQFLSCYFHLISLLECGEMNMIIYTYRMLHISYILTQKQVLSRKCITKLRNSF